MSSPRGSLGVRTSQPYQASEIKIYEGSPFLSKQPQSSNRNNRMAGAFQDLIIACAIISLPMLVLSAILLILIYHYRVQPTTLNGADLALSQPAIASENAYLVRFSATRLITVASWSSSVAPLLPTFVMTLMSYPAAQGILRASRNGSRGRLPTPYQMNLFISMLGGSIGSLWHWIKYRTWKNRERLVWPVKVAVAALTASNLLGYLILAADTWLHVTTSTTPFTQITKDQTFHNYGRGIYSSECANYTCNLIIAATGAGLAGASEAYPTLNNMSNINQVLTFNADGQDYAFLGDATRAGNVDFQASTFAAATSCQPISRKCNLQAESGVSTPYNCTPAFSGDLTGCPDDDASRCPDPANIYFFADPAYTKPVGHSNDTQNPLYFGITALVRTNFGVAGLDSSNSLANDSEIITPIHGGLSWILGCQTTIYETQYTWNNGSFGDAVPTVANTSMAALYAAPFATSLVQNPLQNINTIAGFSNSSAELARIWSTQFSQAIMALSAGVMSPRINLQEQTRTTFLVTRVPRTPLFALLGFNLLYALVGLLLGLIALCFDPSGSKAVQARLSVAGISAALFEDQGRNKNPSKTIEGLFGENTTTAGGERRRIGVIQTDRGGWTYKLNPGT